MKGSLDSNVLIRLLVDDVSHQVEQAKDLVQSGDFKVQGAAVIEVMFVLERNYNMKRKVLVESIYRLMQHPNLRFDIELFAHDLFTLFIDNSKLSPEDCYLVAKAQHNKALPLWTFDKELVKKSGGLAREVV